MRKVIHDILTTDDVFSGLMPTLYERGSVPDAPTLPFAVYAMVGSPRQGRAFPMVSRIELWCYDSRGDYSKIDEALLRADELFTEILHREKEGQRIAEATPQGWSGDLYDDLYKANTRNAGYLLVGTAG